MTLSNLCTTEYTARDDTQQLVHYRIYSERWHSATCAPPNILWIISVVQPAEQIMQRYLLHVNKLFLNFVSGISYPITVHVRMLAGNARTWEKISDTKFQIQNSEIACLHVTGTAAGFVRLVVQLKLFRVYSVVHKLLSVIARCKCILCRRQPPTLRGLRLEALELSACRSVYQKVI
jgi:hypothetical protein